MSAEIQSQYHQNGYALVESAATREVADSLLGLIHHDITSAPALRNFLSVSDVNKKPAYQFYGYHYPPVMGFHWGLTSRMMQVTGRKLAPTYAYFRVYQQGDVCIVHSDREACEHSFSMPLGYSDDLIWPFEIGSRRFTYEEAGHVRPADTFGEEASRSLMLQPGDAVLYQGCSYRHGRVTPNPNRWSAHLFLHWVDTEGPFRDWAFDKQKMPKAGQFAFPAAAPA
jgi:hypothetical protein